VPPLAANEEAQLAARLGSGAQGALGGVVDEAGGLGNGVARRSALIGEDEAVVGPLEAEVGVVGLLHRIELGGVTGVAAVAVASADQQRALAESGLRAAVVAAEVIPEGWPDGVLVIARFDEIEVGAPPRGRQGVGAGLALLLAA